MHAVRRLPRDRARTCLQSTLRYALGYERTRDPEYLSRLAASILMTFRVRADPADQHALDTAGDAGFPPVVCLCGSTRFVDEFNRQRKELTERGEIVLSIEIVTTQAREHDPQHADPALKARLDELHKRKIDLADYVLVLNVGGYIGESTRSEIAYATAHGKPVRYLEPAGCAA